jgi:hypothetical protein
LAWKLNDSGDFVSMAEPSEHISTTEARAGATPHVTRVVLGVGLLLVIAIFALILLVAG